MSDAWWSLCSPQPVPTVAAGGGRIRNFFMPGIQARAGAERAARARGYQMMLTWIVATRSPRRVPHPAGYPLFVARPMSDRGLPLLLSTLLVLGACAPAGIGNGPLAPLAASNVACQPMEIPETLPGAAMVVDSAALHRDLADLWEGRDLAPGRAAVSIAWDQSGANVRRDVVDHDLAPAIADSIQNLVFAHRTEQERRDEPGEWGVRLMIEMAPDPVFAVERQTYCPPRPLNVREVNEYIHGRYPARGDTRLRSRTQLYVRVAVDRSGRVRDARLERPSGTQIDQFAMQLANELNFRPATVDGIPVDAVAIVRLGDLPW